MKITKGRRRVLIELTDEDVALVIGKQDGRTSAVVTASPELLDICEGNTEGSLPSTFAVIMQLHHDISNEDFFNAAMERYIQRTGESRLN